MLFNSFGFLVFFIVVTCLYFLLPNRARWSLLLLASCFFYMFFKWEYIFILLFTIAVDYYAGIKIESAEGVERKRKWLILSLIANIGVLAFFKYYNFLNGNISGLYSLLGYKNPIPYLHIILPIGLSFHTFQAMSYTIEVFRGHQNAERHFGIYALYVMFYPQLAAGPIERPQHMLPQFHERKQFDYDNLIIGLRLMLWGIFKKVVIADRVAMAVDTVYGDVHEYSGGCLLLAAILYAFQIYCDFSGYSDIALGSARVMGFNLMRNFDHPLYSKSVTEFWRKWHISLSTWLYDYLYLPIVIAKRDWNKFAVAFGLMVTFFISGLWHGAAWTFVFWGVLHGLAVTYEFLSKKPRNRLAKVLPNWLYSATCRILTLAFLVITWIFFRTGSMSQSFYIIKTAFNPLAKGYFHLMYRELNDDLTIMGFARWKFFAVMLGVVGFAVADWLIYKKRQFILFQVSQGLRWAGYALLVICIIFMGVFHSNQFIYFQF
ncbi:MAG: MBOAT family O-acyltransferase [Bacteroidota bacterium]|nr:MBOAT family O-acyltransferase [Bacteroidota bacterium]MDP4253722.1 MBOAT family O-acyltransferase [Bacteroidota bacterium]MDP4259658.1 MBOAT family O-acyltransferase [Bacteroidota bacterium]